MDPKFRSSAEALYARLNVDAARQKVRLEQLLTALSVGDVRRGQLIFHSEKAACYSCHAIGYRGGNVGPDLTGSARSAPIAIYWRRSSFQAQLRAQLRARSGGDQGRQGVQRPAPRRDGR